MEKKLIDCRVEAKGHTMIRTLIYSDGSKETKIVSHKQIDNLISAIRNAPEKPPKSRSTGYISHELIYVLLLGIVLIASASGCRDVNPDCTGP
ncbi:MAG: hypothetical protein ACO3S6_03445, partial [Aquiluna sp.]